MFPKGLTFKARNKKDQNIWSFLFLPNCYLGSIFSIVP